MTQKLALLRGINVGGKNRVAMADLREAFTNQGYEEVATYTSGNVMFKSRKAPLMRLQSGAPPGDGNVPDASG